MKKHIWPVVAMATGLALAGASCGANTNTTNATTNTVNQAPVSGNSESVAPAQQKFTDSPDYQYAYLISSDTLGTDAQTAVTGFDLSKVTQSDGSIVYTLTAKKASYHTQTYTVKSGQSLYFIETSMGDDHGDTDTMLNDDTAVVVDANGYVVTQ